LSHEQQGGTKRTALPGDKQTECARPRAQQHGNVEGFRYDPESLFDHGLLRPGPPHSGKPPRRANLFTERNANAAFPVAFGALL